MPAQTGQPGRPPSPGRPPRSDERPNRLLETLYARREFAMLDELAKAAGLKPSEASAALESLRRRGHRLESSPLHGIRLARPVLIDSRLVEAGLKTRRAGRHVICFAQTDSTNDVAMSGARQADADGLAVFAHAQRRGRGRLGRAWASPPGANVLMSVLLVEPGQPLPHEALTIAAGLAAAEAADEVCGAPCRLRWPNDVLLEGRKLAGVLVERRRGRGKTATVIGIGLNVNAAPPASQIGRQAACLAGHAGEPVETNEVARALLRRLDAWLTVLGRPGGAKRLHEAWKRSCGTLGMRLRVLCDGQVHQGRVVDVSPLEGLELICDDNRRLHLPAERSSVVD